MAALTNSRANMWVEREMLAGAISRMTTGTQAADPAIFLDKAAVITDEDVHHHLNQIGIEGIREM